MKRPKSIEKSAKFGTLVRSTLRTYQFGHSNFSWGNIGAKILPCCQMYLEQSSQPVGSCVPASHILGGVYCANANVFCNIETRVLPYFATLIIVTLGLVSLRLSYIGREENGKM